MFSIRHRSNQEDFFQVHFSQSWSGFFDVVVLGVTNCSVLRGDEVDGYYTSVFTAPDCYGLVECGQTPKYMRYIDLDREFPPRSFTQMTQLQRQPEVLKFPVEFSQNMMQNAPCFESTEAIVTGGFISSTAEIVTLPVYRYATLDSRDNSTTAGANVSLSWNGSRSAQILSINSSIVTLLTSNGTELVSNLQTFVVINSSLSTSLSYFTETDPLVISKVTSDKVICTISDVSSFTMEYYNETASISGRFVQDCSVADSNLASLQLQLACVEDDNCVGYTSTLDDVGLCLLYAGHDTFDPKSGIQRWISLKPPRSSRTCKALVANSANVSVYIRQTYLGGDTVTVYAGDAFVAECGAQYPFANGAFGRSWECDRWVACYAANVPAGTTLRVEAPATMSSAGCDGAVGVIFAVDDSSFDVLDLTNSPVPATPSELTETSLREYFPFRIDITAGASSINRGFASFFLLNTERATVAVSQTGYDCSRMTSTAARASCNSPAVSMTVLPGNFFSEPLTRSSQSCGGSRQFLLNQSGASDRCTTQLFCGWPVNLNTGLETVPEADISANFSSSSGSGSSVWGLWSDGGTSNTTNITSTARWLKIDFNLQLIVASSHGCPYFSASLYASPYLSSSVPRLESSFSGFALRDTLAQFRTFLAPKVSTLHSVESVASSLNIPLTDLFRIPDLTDFLGYSTLRSAMMINWTSVGSQSLPINLSLGCVMDYITTTTASCLFRVPRAANFIDIRVAQTYFTSDQSIVLVEYLAGNLTVVGLNRCGGSAGFSGRKSLDEQCQTFLPCKIGLLPNAPDVSYIRLVVPSNVVGTATCRAVFAATVDFSFLNVTGSAALNHTCSGFVCSADLSCISNSQICDGVVDCIDGQDEAMCNAWLQVESSQFIIAPGAPNNATINSTSWYSVKSFLECKGIAARAGTTALSLSTDQKTCVIYSSILASAFLKNPSSFLVQSSEYNVFARLASASQYARCSAELNCNGHGVVTTTIVNNRTQCTCFCDAGYSAADCSVRLSMASVGPLALVFSSNSSSIVTVPSVANAITGIVGNSFSVSCSPFESSPGVNGSVTLVTFCQISGPSDNDAVFLLESPTGQQALASVLGSYLQGVAATTMPYPQQLLCNASGCSSGRVVKAAKVSLSLSASNSPNPFAVSLIDTSSRRSSSGGQFACGSGANGSVTTLLSSGCMSTTCVYEPSSPISVSRVLFGNGTSIATSTQQQASDPCSSSLQMDVTVPLGVDPIERVPIKNALRKDEFTAFSIAVALLATGVVLIAAGVYILRSRILLEIPTAINDLHSADDDEHSQVAMDKVLYASKMATFFLDPIRQRALRFALAVLVSAVVAFLLGWLYFVLFAFTPSARSSSVVVLAEFYRTSACSSSPFSPLATKVVIVDAETGLECRPRRFIGNPASQLFTSATCDIVNGVRVVKVQMGISYKDCREAAVSFFPDGECGSSPLLGDSSSVVFSCGSENSAKMRLNSFLALNGNADADSAFTRALSAPTTFLQYWDTVTANTGSIFSYSRIQGSEITHTTSTHSCRFESVVDSAHFVGPLDTLRNIVNSPISDPSIVSTLPMDLRSQGPQDGDYPVGFIYNRFETTRELVLAAAGPSAARYYGIRGAAADIGQQLFQTSRFSTSGSTIGMYLRVSETTRGFAFVIADARENTLTATSPVVEKLLSAILYHIPTMDGSAWFHSAYNAYSSLYVDGTDKSLHFIFANSPDVKTSGNTSDTSNWTSTSQLVNVKWDLDKLERAFFDGNWHHTAILLRSENGQLKAQLVIDGVTSRTSRDWNQCLNNISPRPIQHYDATADLPVSSVTNERVLNDGVLFTGYFNGGVAHLEFSPFVRSVPDVINEGKEDMRTITAKASVQFLVLACFATATAIVFMLWLGRDTFTRFRRERRASFQMLQERSRKLYRQFWALRPADSGRQPYDVLDFSTARQLTQLSEHDFHILLELLVLNYAHPAEILIRILHFCATASDTPATKEPPSADEWRRLVQSAKNIEAPATKSVVRFLDLVTDSDDGNDVTLRCELSQLGHEMIPEPSRDFELEEKVQRLTRALQKLSKSPENEQLPDIGIRGFASIEVTNKNTSEGSTIENCDEMPQEQQKSTRPNGFHHESVSNEAAQLTESAPVEHAAWAELSQSSEDQPEWFGDQGIFFDLPPLEQLPNCVPDLSITASIDNRRNSTSPPALQSSPPDAVYNKLRALLQQAEERDKLDPDAEEVVFKSEVPSEDGVAEDEPVIRPVVDAIIFEEFSLPSSSTTISEDDESEPLEQHEEQLIHVPVDNDWDDSDGKSPLARMQSRISSRSGTFRRRRSRLASFRSAPLEAEVSVPQEPIDRGENYFIRFRREVDPSYKPSIGELIVPVLLSLQVLALWSKWMTFPIALSESYLKIVFRAVLADVSALSGTPGLATPLIQATVSLVVTLVAITMICSTDQHQFVQDLGLYVVRFALKLGYRLDCGETTITTAAFVDPNEASSDVANPSTAEDQPQPPRSNDYFPGEQVVSESGDDDSSKNGSQISIAGDNSNDSRTESEENVVDSCVSHCAIHLDELLIPFVQDADLPAASGRIDHCHFSTNGVRCEKPHGQFYRCACPGCEFSVCDTHFVDSRVTRWISLWRGFSMGPWLLTALPACVFALAVLFYLPSVMSALMILSCGPQYQCFMGCWASVDQNFLSAAFASLALLIVVGCGFPVVLFVAIYHRITIIKSLNDAMSGSSSFIVRLDKLMRCDSTALRFLYLHGTKLHHFFRTPIIVTCLLLLAISASAFEIDSIAQVAFVFTVQFSATFIVFRTTRSRSLLYDAVCKLSLLHCLIFIAAFVIDGYLLRSGNGSVETLLVAIPSVYLALSAVAFLTWMSWTLIRNEQMRLTNRTLMKNFDLRRCAVKCVSSRRLQNIRVEAHFGECAPTSFCGNMKVDPYVPPNGHEFTSMVTKCLLTRQQKQPQTVITVPSTLTRAQVWISECKFEINPSDDYDVAWLFEAILSEKSTTRIVVSLM